MRGEDQFLQQVVPERRSPCRRPACRPRRRTCWSAARSALGRTGRRSWYGPAVTLISPSWISSRRRFRFARSKSSCSARAPGFQQYGEVAVSEHRGEELFGAQPVQPERHPSLEVGFATAGARVRRSPGNGRRSSRYSRASPEAASRCSPALTRQRIWRGSSISWGSSSAMPSLL